MNPHRVSIVLLFLCFLIIFRNGSNSPIHSITDVSINCGSTGTFTALNGKQWVGDVIKPKYSSLLQIQGSSTTSTVNHHKYKLISTDPIPYKTARISRNQFFYAFQVKPGQKILRLHFSSGPYKGFKGLNDLFTVEAGPFILLSHFSASLTADALGVSSFSKEFCLNIRENEQFNVTFFPESNSQLIDTYAFINGIEIISVPSSVSYFHGGDIGVQVVGEQSPVYVDHHMALELIHRQNMKQDFVRSFEDFDDTFPMWALRKAEKVKNTTWEIAVDVGFRYLIRLHFSDMGLKIARSGDVMFRVLINEMSAQTNFDIVKYKDDGNKIFLYKDYTVMMRGQRKEGKREISISLHSYDELIEGQLVPAGFEMFKLSNPDNSLASSNPLPPFQSSPSKTSLTWFSIFRHKNAFAFVAVTIISFVNIVVHKLREYSEANNTKEENKPSARAERLCRRFSLVEIQFATRNFSDALLIGRGGFGKVYKGLIDRGQTTIAVKRLKSNSRQGAHEFLMEIETLSELRHVNLVSLIGYCNEHREMILVYDYMIGGTLADHLYKLARESNNCPSLPWKQRLNICIGAGRGLDYLHTGHGVIHRDVKTSNILLDENFMAKVSDFGLAKHEDRSKLQSHVSTRVKGTNGYLDPHYLQTGKLTRKSDTYAFGVVLFEVLCGRPAVDSSVAEDEHILTIWARDMFNKGEVDRIVTSSLREEIVPPCLMTFVRIAERCLRGDPKNRPTMSQVVQQLEVALDQQENKQVLVLNEITSGSDDIRPSIKDEKDSVSKGKSPMVSRPVPYPTSPPEEQTNSQVVNAGLPPVRRDVKKATTRKPLRLWPWDTIWNRVKPSKKSDLLSEIWDDANIRSTKFDWDMIAAATKQFSTYRKIGQDVFGSIYMGVLPTRQLVAVKKFSPSSTQLNHSEFQNEIHLLSNLQHRNIIKLLGYCIHREEKLIVYEFMENATLYTLLGDEVQRRRLLQWEGRFKIIMGIARGVVYLHHDSGLRVIHKDVHLSHILLDVDMNPKISGFAFGRALVENDSEVETARVVGTFGYIAPECFYGKYSVKTDVYSFGITMLEILSGSRMSDWRRVPNTSYSGPLDYAWELWSKGRSYDLMDESLEGAFPVEEALRCIQVGLLCTQTEPNHRPTMPCVVKMLEGDEPLVDPLQPLSSWPDQFGREYSVGTSVTHSEGLLYGDATFELDDTLER
ncbi:hypothetical protein OROMI_029941 [Orobanche minor]